MYGRRPAALKAISVIKIIPVFGSLGARDDEWNNKRVLCDTVDTVRASVRNSRADDTIYPPRDRQRIADELSL